MFQFRPCIDLRNGKVTQIVGSTLQSISNTTTSSSSSSSSFSSSSSSSFTDTATENFITSTPSSYYASLYHHDLLPNGHIIMLGTGNQEAALDALSAYPNGLQIGGGIDESNALEWIEAGAKAVIVTSWVFREGQVDWERLERLSKKVEKERLVIDLSCRRKPQQQQQQHQQQPSSSDSSSSSSSSSCPDLTYYVVTDRWQRFTSYPVSPSTLSSLSSYCCEFLVHGVDVEGKQAGIEEELVSLLSTSPIPVTYAGGVRSLEDIERVWELGKGRVNVSVGSALDLFGGKLEYEKVKNKCEELRERSKNQQQQQQSEK